MEMEEGYWFLNEDPQDPITGYVEDLWDWVEWVDDVPSLKTLPVGP